MKKFARIICLALVTVMLVCSLASCMGPKKDPDKAEKALEKKGYEVSVIDTDALLPDGVEAILNAHKGSGDDGERVAIYYFETAKDAKEFYDESKDKLEEMKEAYKDEDIKFVYGKSGKVVYAGTKKAVRAA